MLFDLNEVLRVDGKVKQFDVDLGKSTIMTGFGEFPVVHSTPVALSIRNKGNKELSVRGSADIVLRIPCDRCLEDVDVELKVDFEKEVDMKDSAQERIQALDEQYYIEGYNLDVDELVCSEILVSWPSKVLCKDDCKGLCNTCGTNLNLKTCNCEPTDLDPRMAQIQEIFNKFKEV